LRICTYCRCLLSGWFILSGCSSYRLVVDGWFISAWIGSVLLLSYSRCIGRYILCRRTTVLRSINPRGNGRFILVLLISFTSGGIWRCNSWGSSVRLWSRRGVVFCWIFYTIARCISGLPFCCFLLDSDSRARWRRGWGRCLIIDLKLS
jgi:hypothetical protein